MNGTEKDHERTKEFLAGETRKKEQIRDLKKELRRFVYLQQPGRWTVEQLEMMSLRGLLQQAYWLAGKIEG